MLDGQIGHGLMSKIGHKYHAHHLRWEASRNKHTGSLALWQPSPFIQAPWQAKAGEKNSPLASAMAGTGGLREKGQKKGHRGILPSMAASLFAALDFTL